MLGEFGLARRAKPAQDTFIRLDVKAVLILFVNVRRLEFGRFDLLY